jgi:hypothetical protein
MKKDKEKIIGTFTFQIFCDFTTYEYILIWNFDSYIKFWFFSKFICFYNQILFLKVVITLI